MLPLVIDKSFGQAFSAEALEALSKRFTFLVPTALYYEAFTTSDRSRRALVLGFPEFQRVHLPSILRTERSSGQPALAIEREIMQFNPAIAELDFRLEGPHQTLVDRHREESVEPMVDFCIDIARHWVPGFSDAEIERCDSSESEFIDLCYKLNDRDRIRQIARDLEYPHAENIDSRWLHYRKLQALVLQGLVLRRRYPDTIATMSRERVEHDVQDLEYLILGLHAGRLATRDASEKLSKASLAWRAHILEPRVEVFTEC